MGRRDWNEPRYYSVDPFLDTSATEPPESATLQIPGIDSERGAFKTLQVIETDITGRYILDGEVIDSPATWSVATKLLEDGQDACFVFAGSPTYIYWKFRSGTTSVVNGGSWALYKGEIMSKARAVLEAGS